ncbi:MAG: glycosyltransferase [Planctomycetota bacterium]|nr:glycosyltransferase [Planctomycetota bacterium]
MSRMTFLIDDLLLGGSELCLRDLLFSIHEDHEIMVVTLFGGGPIGEELKRSGIPVHILRLTKLNAPWKLLQLILLLRARRIEVLDCERTVASIFGVLAGWLAGVPKIFVKRGSLPWWPNSLYRALDRLAMVRSDGVIVPSKAIREGLMKEQSLPERIFTIIPHGVAIPAGGPSQRPEKGNGNGEGPTVGCVANFNPRKDHESLIEAFRMVSDDIPAARLILVGSGPLEAELRERVANAGLREKVQFLGTRTDVPSLLPGFDLLVLPSLTEGFGRVLIEAMAAGVPVIASAVGGVPEVVSDGWSGLLVRPRSPDDLHGAILRLLSDPGEAERLATNALRDVRARFSLPCIVSEYVRTVGISQPAAG